MRKLHWLEFQMAASAYLDDAVRWSKDLVRMRSRGPGDTENAMRSIAREYGVDYGTIWRLRYRRSALKDIGVTAYMRLRAAYQAECRRQLGKLKNEIAITEAACGASSDLLDAAKALCAENGESVNDDCGSPSYRNRNGGV